MLKRPRPVPEDAWLNGPQLNSVRHRPRMDLRDPLSLGSRPAFEPLRTKEQRAIPCVMMRGGTSKGLFFLARDLPPQQEIRDRVLLAALGSPDRRQIDGLGGGDSLTSKVAIVAPSIDENSDVDYLFAQVLVERPIVDTSPSCGNILAGVATFAIEEGLVLPQPGGVTRVRIRAVNNRSYVEAIVQTPGRRVRYEGQARIDGVPGTGAPIVLNFRNVVGSKTGKMLPTGRALDVFDGVEVTCLDVAMPVVLMRASDFGKSGHESPPELSQDRHLMNRLESIRRLAGEAMGFTNVSEQVIPKVALVSPAGAGGTLTSRYFVPEKCHATHAVTGAICVAAGCVIPGSLAHQIAPIPVGRETIEIEHPAGRITLQMTSRYGMDQPEIVEAGVVSTARRLFEGKVLVPGSLWDSGR